MALILDQGTCQYCGQTITLRRYADLVELWVTGPGQYPGDQRLCEAKIDGDGSYGRHWVEP